MRSDIDDKAAIARSDVAILNALPAQIALLDREGVIISVNEAWHAHGEARGLQGSSIGVNYLRVCQNVQGTGSFEARRAAAGIRAVLNRRVSGFSMEYPCHSSTAQAWFLMSVAPLEGHERGSVVVMHVDVTERKRGQENQLRFVTAIDAISDAIFLVDRSSMRFVYANDSACQALGLPRLKLLCMAPWTLLSVSREELERDYDLAIQSQTEVKPIEMRRPDQDHPERWVELRRRAQNHSDHWMIVTLIRDITERKQAEARIKRLNRVYSVLGSINAILVRVQGREELYQEACRISVAAGFAFAWIGLCDRALKRIVPVAWSGCGEGYLQHDRLDLREEASVPAQSVREGRVKILNDLRECEVAPLRDEALQRGFRSMAVLPLVVNGASAGILMLYAQEFGYFNDDEVRLLNELASNISFAMDHLDRAERIRYLAYRDPLTEFANRAGFHELLAESVAEATEKQRTLMLVLVDIERFKTINDTFGRQAADDLLRAVAARWPQYPTAIGRPARIDADHFAVMIAPNNVNATLGERIKEGVEKALLRPFKIGEAEITLSAKFGIAMFPGDGKDGDTLLRNAEAALKRAKALGARYLFYTQSMNASVAENLALENRLRQALEKQEFVLHYQPKLDVASGRLIGAEALIRWNDPRTGLVPPGRFIPVLEETGLIYDVGRWALNQALKDFLGWKASGLPAVRIAVNVSPLQLREKTFADEIRRVIAIDRDAAGGLELEITESLVMEDVKHSSSILETIRGLGVTIAIDDFGTGFSSLSYLSKLPIDTLKIDRSFVQGMLSGTDGRALISTIIRLAHALKLKVVAEGVETLEQLDLLKCERCDEMQGFLVSKGLPAETFGKDFLVPRRDSFLPGGTP